MSPSPTVMVIDDNTSVVDLIRQMLTRAGVEVVGCSDLRQAEAIIQTVNPSAVIFELRRRTEYAGWSLLSMLRTNIQTRAIPVVVTSGDVALLRRYEADLGALGVTVLVKPFTVDALLARLNALMRSADAIDVAPVPLDAVPLEATI